MHDMLSPSEREIQLVSPSPAATLLLMYLLLFSFKIILICCKLVAIST